MCDVLWYLSERNKIQKRRQRGAHEIDRIHHYKEQLALFTLILHKQNDKRNKNIYVYEHFGLRHMSCLGIRVKDHLHSNTCIWMVLVIFQLSSMISYTNMDQRGFFALHDVGPKRRPERGEWEPNQNFTAGSDLVKSQVYSQTLEF